MLTPVHVAVADGALAATPSTPPGSILKSPEVVRSPVAGSLPVGFRFSSAYLPEGFVEAKGAQATFFSFGSNANASAPRKAPGFFRAWMRPVSPTKFDLIIAIVAVSNRSDPSMNPFFFGVRGSKPN